MDTQLPEPAVDCTWVLCREPRHARSPPPYQLSFLSPIADATAGTQEEGLFENDPEYIHTTRRLRRRRCRNLKPADVDQGTPEERALLRTPGGAFIAPLYARKLVVDSGG